MVFSINFFLLLIIIFAERLTLNNTCFEFSCEECLSEEFGTCTKCKENFELIDGTCPCKDPSCALCDTGFQNASCYLCKNSYNRKKNRCQFSCRFENCYDCREDYCLVCENSYSEYFNYSEKKCMPKPQKTQKNKCNVAFCEECDPNNPDECDKCEEDFVLNYNWKCSLSPDYVSCEGLKCNNNNGKYTVCFNNSCIFCYNNRIYPEMNCENNYMCNIENCQICRTVSECLQCKPGYYPEKNKCKEKCIKGCYMCSTNETCDNCMTGYKKDSEGKCILNSTYLNFNTSLYEYQKELLMEYFDNINNNETSKNIEILDKLNGEHCSIFNDEKGICETCIDPYSLIDNKCQYVCTINNCINCTYISPGKENCIKCKDFYDLKNNACIFNNTCYDKNCAICSNEGINSCLKCKKDYELYIFFGVKKCTEKIIINYETEKVTDIINNTNINNISNISNVNNINRNDNFNNNNDNVMPDEDENFCKEKIKNCKICSDGLQCSECEENYYLGESKLVCVKIITKDIIIICLIVGIFLVLSLLAVIVIIKLKLYPNNHINNNANINQNNANIIVNDDSSRELKKKSGK